jgi:exopolysaccharide biosynthesis protein
MNERFVNGQILFTFITCFFNAVLIYIVQNELKEYRYGRGYPVDNNRYGRSNRRYGNTPIRKRPHTAARQGRFIMPLPAVLILDLLGVALVVGVFCLFYFILPRTIVDEPITLPISTATSQATASSAVSPDPTISVSKTPDTTATLDGSTTATPDATPADQGLWGVKFQDKFAIGNPEITDTSYKSKDISVAILKHEKDGITWYVADIYVRNLENLKTAFAKDSYGKGITEPTLDMAVRNNAIVAISGDYYGNHETGIVVRNGKLYRKTALEDVLIMNNDGSMQTFDSRNFNVNNVINNGAWQAWSFGPMLLEKNGQPMTKFNSTLNPTNPRSAIGYYEPGHYCLVVVDGRQPGYSDGISLKAFSQLFADMGCKAAYNFDGGQTAVMTFMGKWVNKPYHDGRNVSDIVYIGETTN